MPVVYLIVSDSASRPAGEGPTPPFIGPNDGRAKLGSLKRIPAGDQPVNLMALDFEGDGDIDLSVGH
jgi:hypothetical protein